MTTDRQREVQLEARAEAVPLALVAAGTLAGLAAVSAWRGWELVDRRLWWVWLALAVPELLLGAALLGGLGRIDDAERRRRVAAALIAVVVAGSLVGLGLLVLSLVHFGRSVSGAQLLASAAALLLTNVVAFALAFWELDCGGPARRALAEQRTAPDFQFPQDENAQLARPGWQPQLLDYAYFSFTNSVAFSPTDVMPLTRPAKALMAVESAISFATVLVVAARAINILGA